MSFILLRRTFALIGACLAIFVTSVSSAQVHHSSAPSSVCEIRGEVDSRVKGRASRIEFPNGRQVIVVGHIHGHRQMYSFMDKIAEGELQNLSDREFEDLLRKTLSENREERPSVLKSYRENARNKLLRDSGVSVSETYVNEGFDFRSTSVAENALEDYGFLQDLLRDRQVEFVGFEGEQSVLNANFRSYVIARQVLLSEVARRKAGGGLTLSEKDIREALISSFNGHIWAYSENPGLMSVVPMIGTEDEGLRGSADENSLDDYGMAYKEFLKLDEEFSAKMDASQKEKLMKNKKVLAGFLSFAALHSDIEDRNISSVEELQKRWEEVMPMADFIPGMKDVLTKMREVSIKRVRYSIARDQASSLNLARTYRSGVHFVGLNHFRSTMEGLRQACLAELGVSTPASSQGRQ